MILPLKLIDKLSLVNLKFDTLIRLGNWFNCLLSLMHIHLKNLKSNWEKWREIWDKTLTLTQILNDYPGCGAC